MAEAQYFPVVERIAVPELKDCVWKLGTPLANGLFGQTYTACCESNCKFVLKYISGGVFTIGGFQEYNKTHFENEVNIQSIAASNGLAPRVYDAWMSEPGFAFVMEKMKMSLKRALETMPEEKRIAVVLSAYAVLKAFHALGYIHGDAHVENFMLDEDDNVKLIDFGFAHPITDPNEPKEDTNKLANSLLMTYRDTPELGAKELIDIFVSMNPELDKKPKKRRDT
jgi:serine/threonine protein kinase